MVTRAEYLAGSLSRRQPWLAEGISRRQWERRRRKITALESAPAKEYPSRDGERPPKGRQAAVGPTEDASQVSAHKRPRRRHDEDLLMRRIHDYWDAHCMIQSDPQALSKAIHTIKLPERFKN